MITPCIGTGFTLVIYTMLTNIEDTNDLQDMLKNIDVDMIINDFAS
jgi:hypothetical protein